MKKAVIFDLDGTLLNTLIDLQESVNGVLAKHNFPTHHIDKYKYFLGNGIEVLTRKAFPKDVNDTDFEKYLSEVKTEYSSRQTSKTRPYDGIPELLKELNNKGIKIAILSNKPNEFARPTVEHFFGDIKFEVVFGARQEVARKPSAEAVTEILDIFGLQKEDCLFVGDSETDMQTGVNAGMQAVGVSWGFRTVDEMKENGASFIIDKPEELFLIING
ncbi:MAG: hypothetical protein B6I18_06250 [Bacteroidetes bacterium 4572_112]|nr:MAG: hypothetical protein B6I18_06250 [Bacteroidetes bacterium 4572_112]